jgi:DUF4097 and DUF4098 domain-containing protein YvlB
MGKIMKTISKSVIITSLIGLSMMLHGQSSVSRDINLEAGKTSERGISSVSGDVTIGKNARVLEAIETVSGDIEIAVKARVQNINSVSGDISLGKQVKSKGIETVSGDIQLYGGVDVDGSVETVSGDIMGHGDCSVRQDITTVSGDIELDNGRIHGDIITVSGDIALFNGTVVEGDIIIKRKKEFMSGAYSKLKVIVDMNSLVKGSIRVKEEDTNVVVILSNGGKVRGEIINAEVREN